MRLCRAEEGIAEIHLDRPPANPLGIEEVAALEGIVAAVAADVSIKVVLVLSLSRMFCAGADLMMMAALGGAEDGPAVLTRFARDLQAVFRRFRALPICTIAGVAGTATGGGLEFALSCDIRVIGRTVRCGLPEILLGLIPAAGGTQLVAELAGKATANRLILSGELISGEEAYRLNLAQHLVANEAVEKTSREIARGIAARSREGVVAAKRCIALAPSESGYAHEIEASLSLHQRAETRALIMEFLKVRNQRKDASRVPLQI